jgi:diguanylate cyclase (GGDEF)-like protein
VTELSDEVLFEYDFKKDVLTLSERFTELYGQDHVIDSFRKDMSVHMRSIHPEDRKATIEQLLRTRRVGANDIQFRLKDTNNEYQWCRVLYRAVCDEKGGPFMAIGKIANISLFKKEIEQLAYESKTDSMTGAYNKMATKEMVDAYIRNQGDGAHMMLLIDVDDFKKVNDTYGHQYGDYVLKTVADLMKQSFRKTDLLYRYGGEELVMIMPETNIEGATIPVQRLRRMVEEYDFDYNGVKAKVTVSIGLTMNYQNLNSSADILKSADEALYKAKEEGRNRVILYEQ